MRIFAFRAELLCESCGKEVRLALVNESKQDSGDTDDFPQPGSSEDPADSPRHCANCGCFLENSLTSEGEAYTVEKIVEAIVDGDGDKECIQEWLEFYGGNNDIFCRQLAAALANALIDARGASIAIDILSKEFE